MIRTPGLGHIILVLMLLATFLRQQPVEWHTRVWAPELLPPPRGRRYYNPRRNRERWLRRLARRERRWPQAKHRQRRRRRVQGGGIQPRFYPPPADVLKVRHPEPTIAESSPKPSQAEGLTPFPPPEPPDPLADLRDQRGWIDQVPEQTVWALLIRLRWPHGPCCPHCREDDPEYLELIDPDYHSGLGRWRCRVCAEAGDPGEGGTFTPLTGTILEGMRVDIRTLWLIVARFVEGKASVETAKEAGVHRHTTDRHFRLLRAALYQARSQKPIALGSADIVEGDEVYIIAGLKGNAGGLALNRRPRRRGLKRRGRGTWDSDKVPVFGLLCRSGEARLFVLPNVRTETIRPIVKQMVRQGARVYTDSYPIYNFLEEEGYQHATVNHSAGEYARGEVHCNTMECTWSWLRQMVRTYRGISKVYLPLYVVQFEFFYNRRDQNTWNRTLDLFHVALQVDGKALRQSVEGSQLAEVCPVIE
jgi:transposase-like protein